MALSEFDRSLLERCLAREPRSWENFVDRFLGLVMHVIDHTASSRSIQISSADREDLAAEVFLAIVRDEFAVLRRFRGRSSLATYLTVVARRVVVRQIVRRSALQTSAPPLPDDLADERDDQRERMQLEEVEQLMSTLDSRSAEMVRMYHLEGKSYDEIGRSLGVPANSVGPTLSRARTKLRAGTNPTAMS